MNTDMSRYLSLFVSEATEHLENLSADLVKLETEPSRNAIESMFRHAHSVKGMAASMGFDRTASIAHRMEDLADAIRSEPGFATREVIDLLLASTDALLNQVRAAGKGAAIEDEAGLDERLVARLAELRGQSISPAPSSSSPSSSPSRPVNRTASSPPSAPSITPRISVNFQLASSCQAPGPRAFLALSRLAKLGTIFELRPPMQELRAGRIPETGIQLELETKGDEGSVRAALTSVAEIESVSIQLLSPALASSEGADSVKSSSVPAERPENIRTVRIRTELLDHFLDTVGELILSTSQIREVGKSLPVEVRPRLEEGVDRLHSLIKGLHEKVMSARMTPVSVLAERLPRTVRDLARKCSREIELVVKGAEVELDRNIIDSLSDPLVHILRNCIDHGIESPEERGRVGKNPKGGLSISFSRERDRVVVEVADDGRGINPEKLKAAAIARGAISEADAARMNTREALMLCCLPGVSTAADVSEISGRGVGMDAVKRTIEDLGGSVEIETEQGRGTKFLLHLPLTVAVVNVMLVGVGEEVVGLPVTKVLSALEADSQLVSQSEGVLFPYSNSLLRAYTLSDVLGVPGTPRIGVRPYLVVEGNGGQVALAVDRLLGQEEVVLKTLSRPLDLVPGLSGVTILGTGRPVFILDIPRLLAA
jgi:two-component system chemotaxis sensor kinase CheA